VPENSLESVERKGNLDSGSSSANLRRGFMASDPENAA